MNTRRTYLLGLLLGSVLAATSVTAAEQLRALIVDGQNNHDWQSCTPLLKSILENSGRFTVQVTTTPPAAPNRPAGPRTQATAE